MALFNCKQCGGDIRPNEDGYTGKCEYCGAIQTLPKDKDERIGQLLNRANDFRMNCDFDRAIFEYEKVLEIDEKEPEAHWGLFLSKYGVEYVKDTETLVYKPTLHRISSVSVFDDIDYQATIKYASFVATEQYKKDATAIESVMKEFLVLSTSQEPYDIFISYKELDDVTRQRTDDSYLAHDLYNELTTQGYKVFFAPKSLIGEKSQYEAKIYSAIISSKAMIVLGTKPQYLEGVWVKNEWSRFAELIEHGEDKIIIPVFKNMEAGQLPTRIARYNAYDMSSMTFLPTLFEILSKSVKKQSKIEFNKDTSAEAAFLERGFIALEDREFGKADSFFENALNLNPHSSQAYFGKLMVEMRVSKQEQILTSEKPLNEYKNFEKALRFADQQTKITLLQYEERVQDSFDLKKYNLAFSIIESPNVKEADVIKATEIVDGVANKKNFTQKNLEFKSKTKELLLHFVYRRLMVRINEANKRKLEPDSKYFPCNLSFSDETVIESSGEVKRKKLKSEDYETESKKWLEISNDLLKVSEYKDVAKLAQKAKYKAELLCSISKDLETINKKHKEKFAFKLYDYMPHVWVIFFLLPKISIGLAIFTVFYYGTSMLFDDASLFEVFMSMFFPFIYTFDTFGDEIVDWIMRGVIVIADLVPWILGLNVVEFLVRLPFVIMHNKKIKPKREAIQAEINLMSENLLKQIKLWNECSFVDDDTSQK